MLSNSHLATRPTRPAHDESTRPLRARWLLGALLALAPAADAHDGELPPGFELVKSAPWIPGSPTNLEFLPDGRAMIATKSGTVRLVTDGVLQSTPVLNLSSEVNTWGDRGLLGLAIHPGFVPDAGPQSWIYLLYTVTPTGVDEPYNENDVYRFSRLSRYRVTEVGVELYADPSSREVLLGNALPDGSVPDAIASIHESHSNGVLEFGDDGMLLVTTGDGGHFDFADPGGFDDPAFDDWVHPVTGLRGPMPKDQDSGAFRSQDLRSLSGKVLRIDPDTAQGLPSNPFWNGDPNSNASRVWAVGLRNPFRATLVPGTGHPDPALADPGDLLIADVGHTRWEELDRCRGGENFSWPCNEAAAPLPGLIHFVQPPSPYNYLDCSSPKAGTVKLPFLAYHHSAAALYTPGGTHVDHEGNPGTGFTGSAITAVGYYPGGAYPPEYAGNLFIADYGEDWVRRVVLDAQGAVTAVHDFHDAAANIVDMEAHPITGDLYWLSLNWDEGHLTRLRYTPDQTPTAVAVADLEGGPAPLSVNFDGTGSSDPENQPLTFSWDFGDGSPPSDLAAPQHTYLQTGLFDVQLTVSDPGGNSASDELQIGVGNAPPSVTLTSPQFGSTFQAPALLQMTAVAQDPEGEPLSWFWSVDEYHDNHVHPEIGFGTTPDSFGFFADLHGEQTELVYFRLQVRVTDAFGLTATDHVFVYPTDKLHDVTGTMPPASMIEDSGAGPQGAGNHDLEVVRDAVFGAPGSADAAQQYDTFQSAGPSGEDWIGFTALTPPKIEQRFVGLDFQEGLHGNTGGWWQDFRVEVWDGAVWAPVTHLAVDPPYPFELAGTPGFDGASFDTYALRFDPLWGSAIRLIGTPGGSDGFLSVGELRVLEIEADAPDGTGDIDVTAEAVASSKVEQLVPPVPLGQGNQLVSTIANGTFGWELAPSEWVQFDTFHNGDQGSEDWFELELPVSWEFTRLQFQEGINAVPSGGWLEQPTVQVRPKSSAAWQDVTGFTSTPAFPGTVATHAGYELFEIDFDPVVAREIRILGTPGGNDGYSSVSEMRVFATAPPPFCGWHTVGPGDGPADTLRLHAWSVPSLGSVAEVELVGSGGSGIAMLGFALGTGSLPLAGGTLLLDPFTAAILVGGIPVGPDGESSLFLPMPSSPTLLTLDIAFQALVVPLSPPNAPEFSNALRLRLCP